MTTRSTIVSLVALGLLLPMSVAHASGYSCYATPRLETCESPPDIWSGDTPLTFAGHCIASFFDGGRQQERLGLTLLRLVNTDGEVLEGHFTETEITCDDIPDDGWQKSTELEDTRRYVHRFVGDIPAGTYVLLNNVFDDDLDAEFVTEMFEITVGPSSALGGPQEPLPPGCAAADGAGANSGSFLWFIAALLMLVIRRRRFPAGRTVGDT